MAPASWGGLRGAQALPRLLLPPGSPPPDSQWELLNRVPLSVRSPPVGAGGEPGHTAKMSFL